jgi:hypothetical protein
MARPLPVDLLFAGTGAVLLISGIGGQSLGEVLEGDFGDITGKQQAAAAADTEGQGSMTDAAYTNTAGETVTPESVAQASPSSSTFAPSPDTFNKHVTPAQEAKAIAAILLSRGITHPTNRQITEARNFYHLK